MATLTLTKEMDRDKISYRFFNWMFWRLLDLNIKMGWLSSHQNCVYDDHDMIDTLGSSRDKGKFIETYSCELYYQQTIKTRFFTINIVDM